MFRANYDTRIAIGGENCAHGGVFEFEAPATGIVAGLALSGVPSKVTETLIPKVSAGLEPQIRNQWSVYAAQEVSWASQVLCERSCGNGCAFTADLDALNDSLDKITKEQV